MQKLLFKAKPANEKKEKNKKKCVNTIFFQIIIKLMNANDP